LRENDDVSIKQYYEIIKNMITSMTSAVESSLLSINLVYTLEDLK